MTFPTILKSHTSRISSPLATFVDISVALLGFFLEGIVLALGVHLTFCVVLLSRCVAAFFDGTDSFRGGATNVDVRSGHAKYQALIPLMFLA